MEALKVDLESCKSGLSIDELCKHGFVASNYTFSYKSDSQNEWLIVNHPAINTGSDNGLCIKNTYQVLFAALSEGKVEAILDTDNNDDVSLILDFSSLKVELLEE